MRSIGELKQDKRISIQSIGEDGGYAYAFLPGTQKRATIVFSWGDGWDHVSVSLRNRCCTWEEMCYIKDIFFREDECVVQYHPAAKDYVNLHTYCLHLWKPQKLVMPKPPRYMVG